LRFADSSYLVEGLLKRKELLEEDLLFTLDLAVYEVANSLWKHEFLLKDIKSGFEYLAILQGLIETGTIQLLHISKEALDVAYSLAAANNRTVYDTVFVALASELDLELLTFDKRQSEVVKKAIRQKK
jgi:predicted nucleic acid-binding protein